MEDGINYNEPTYEPYQIFDVVSDDVFYIGISGQGNTSSATWKIKKFWTINGITKMGFPDGSQDSIFKWNNRTNYTYI